MRQTHAAAAALVLLTISWTASADTVGPPACVDDHPPSSANAGEVRCSGGELGTCPADDPALKFKVETLSYVPVDSDAPIDVGACDQGAFLCPSGCSDPRASCQIVGRGKSRCLVNLVGRLYRPDPEPPKGSAPAVILIPDGTTCTKTEGVPISCSTECGLDHGQFRPELFCGLKTFLLKRGFVVYEAYPRGYGDGEAQSTGEYFGTRFLDQVNRGNLCSQDTSQPGAKCTVDDLSQEGLEDLGNAVARVQGLPYVDASKVAILGHGDGGLRAIALNTKATGFGVAATAAISPGARPWCSNGGVKDTPMESLMLSDLDNAQAPVFLLTPKNDLNLTPHEEFTDELALDRLLFQSAIYPRVEDASGTAYGNGNFADYCFVNGTAGIDEYGPTLLNFLRRFGVHN